MNENIQMIIISGNNTLDTRKHDGEIEFIFSVEYQSEQEYKFNNYTVKTPEELQQMKNYAEAITLFRKENDLDEKESSYKMVEHIDYFKNFLKEKYPQITQSLHLDRYNPFNEMFLFAKFVERDNIIIANSAYITAMFLPNNPSDIIKQVLISLKDFIEEDSLFEAKVITEAKDVQKAPILTGTYSDILNEYLNINTYKVKKS